MRRKKEKKKEKGSNVKKNININFFFSRFILINLQKNNY